MLRLSSLGDVVLTLPVVHALRRAYPDAALDYWVKEEYADVVRHDPAIAHVRVLERDARRIEDLVSMSAELEDCDLIVDLHGNLRTRVLTFRQKAPVLRAPRYRLRARAGCTRAGRAAAAAAAVARYGAALAPLGLAAEGAPRMHVDAASRGAGRTPGYRSAASSVRSRCARGPPRHQALARGLLVLTGRPAGGRRRERGGCSPREPSARRCPRSPPGWSAGRAARGAPSRCRAWRRCCRAAAPR